MLQPMPTVGPRTAAITGFSVACSVRRKVWLPPCIFSRSARRPPRCIRPTSAPVQKARPSPVTMMARTFSSNRSCCVYSRNCARISQVSAFSFSGRFSTTFATGPSMIRSTDIAAFLRVCAAIQAC